MLTLHKNKNTRVLCQIVSGRKKIDLNYHPTEEVKFMNAVEDLQTFNTQHFRDNFELSKAQAELIFNALNNDDDIEEERLQAKFFKVKRYIKDMLMSSMDLSDTKQRFQIDFEPNLDFSGHVLLASKRIGYLTLFLSIHILILWSGHRRRCSIFRSIYVTFFDFIPFVFIPL